MENLNSIILATLLLKRKVSQWLSNPNRIPSLAQATATLDGQLRKVAPTMPIVLEALGKVRAIVLVEKVRKTRTNSMMK